jgi:cytochrome bd-type quinol oxidase subunit 2
VSYNWWKFLHIAAVFAFVSLHGVSSVVLFRLRRERERRKIEDLISFSGTTITPTYVSLGALLLTGIVAGIQGHWFRYWWIWAAIGVLVLTSGLMALIARPYFQRVSEACAMRPTGIPRKSDEELDQILRGPTFHLVYGTGLAGLLVILYLMIFKPGL